MNIVTTFVEKIKAGYPAIYLQTHEEERAIGYIEEAAKTTGRKVYTWLLGQGLSSKTGKGTGKIADSEEPGQALEQAAKLDQNSIVVLRHYHHFLEAPQAQALLVDIIPKFKASRRMLVFLSPVLKIPPELEKLVSLVEMPLPTTEELLTIVDGFATNVGKPSEDDRHRLAENARGLTKDEAENAVALAAIRPNMGKVKGDAMIWDPEVVKNEKCETVKKTGLLTYYPNAGEGALNQIGGLGFFKEWISRRAAIFKNWDDAMKFKCDVPKGVAVLGVPGTGKSLGAHATAAAFDLPLIRVDMGAIFGGIVGQSEGNARNVIKFLEAVSPCVAWLDEIEKGFAGTSGGQLDSGVGARVLGTFLTWMNDKTSPVFVYATANNVSALPPELLRKGRFDELFYVALPNLKEREEIFRIHISKRGRMDKISKTLDLKQLSHMTAGFSGAEIEAVVREAIDEAFFSRIQGNSAKADLNMFDLQESISKIIPLETLMKVEINALKVWADGRTRPANYPDEVIGIAPGEGRQVEA